MQNGNELETLENGLAYLFLGYKAEFDGIEPVKGLGDEVANAETRLRRLKFGYLERETKDKFLRRISDFDNGGEVSEEAMRSARNETDAREADLDEVNSRLHQRVADFELLATDTTDVYKQLTSRMSEVKLLLAEMEARRVEMDSRLKSAQGKDYVSLLHTDDLERQLDAKNDQLSEVNTVLNSSDKTNETLVELQQKVEEITAENNRLESQEPTDLLASPFQNQGHRLQLLCQLLREHLGGHSFSVEPTSNGYHIVSDQFTLQINADKVSLIEGQLPRGISEPLSTGKLPEIISKTW